MTWIDWATVACVVYAALLSTVVAIKQQLRIRGEWEVLRYKQRLRAHHDRVALDDSQPVDSGLEQMRGDNSTPTEPGEERSVPPITNSDA